jgi:hypothetical protein
MLGRAGDLAILPEKGGAEVVGEVDAPETFAISNAQALKFALAGLGVNTVAVHDGCATRPGRALLILKGIVHSGTPHFFGIGGIQRAQGFFPRLVIEAKDFAVRDDGRSEALAD